MVGLPTKERDPDTGEEVMLYPTREFLDEIQAFHATECQHEGDKELRIYTAKGGATHYRDQCLVCGKAVGKNVSKASVAEDSLVPFDADLERRYRMSREAEKDGIYRRHIKLQQDKDVRFSQDYKDYLASDQWAERRVRVLKRAGGLCEGCLDAKATEVHHLTYQHLFNEFMFELVALCHDCHVRIHTEDEEPTDEFPPEADELPCNGCRYSGGGSHGEAWCGEHDQPASEALAPGGECGPSHKSLAPLK